MNRHSESKALLTAPRAGRHLWLAALMCAIVLAAGRLFAGGPLYSVNGEAVIYSPADMPIAYSADRGSLGPWPNETAVALVDECFREWQAVPTAAVTFQNAGFLPQDVVASNFSLYYDDYADGINPIVFDADGSIIDAVVGYGASDSIMGFAGSDYDAQTGYYIEGIALLNGKFAQWLSYAEFKATFVHEFGHFIGLDHCQINGDFVHDGSAENDIYIPTMYPTATDNDTALGELNPDDKAALTLLYPASRSSVDKAYGTIAGTAVWESGAPVQGANVVAYREDDPYMSRFSSVSDYYMQQDGTYEMHVTPGTYSVYIEAVNRSFTGGSSVGPYAATLRSASFSMPVRTAFYESLITVEAGQRVSGVDFIARPAAACAIVSALGTDAAQLPALHDFRDLLLARSRAGRLLINRYYDVSGPLADIMDHNPPAKRLCRGAILSLMPVIRDMANAQKIGPME